MEPGERSVWGDFLFLAGDSVVPGTICVYPSVPFTDDQLCKTLNISKKLLQSARAKMIKFEKITVNDGCIHIVNWEHFLGEYEKLKEWRDKRKGEGGSEGGGEG